MDEATLRGNGFRGVRSQLAMLSVQRRVLPTLPRLYTVDEWKERWSAPGERYELIEGRPVKKPPLTPGEERAIARLTALLEKTLNRYKSTADENP